MVVVTVEAVGGPEATAGTGSAGGGAVRLSRIGTRGGGGGKHDGPDDRRRYFFPLRYLLPSPPASHLRHHPARALRPRNVEPDDCHGHSIFVKFPPLDCVSAAGASARTPRLERRTQRCAYGG
eukprot:scaffold22891_cov82-Isochrysis_galbana.AAC.1